MMVKDAVKNIQKFYNERILRSRKLNFFIYRRRYLFAYIINCCLAIGAEFALFRFLMRLNVPDIFAKSTGIFFGICIAYGLNAFFNFRIPKQKRVRALVYFIAISFLSLFLNYLLRRQIVQWSLSYEGARLLISGFLFGFAYILHVRFSFQDRKKVGVAIYANGFEDLDSIYDRVRYFSDFIHVDIIDDTFRPDARKTDLSQVDRMRSTWKDKELHAHIMSKTPSKYLTKLFKNVDLICIHLNITESIDEVIDQIRDHGLQAAICLTLKDNIEDLKPFLHKLDMVMFLSIKEPGRSGQSFQKTCFDSIKAFSLIPERSQLSVCVDGGVNEKIIPLLPVEYVVSGSSVLNHPDPVKQIMRLQTSSAYEE